MKQTRREFLSFLGAGLAASSLGCGSKKISNQVLSREKIFVHEQFRSQFLKLKPSVGEELLLHPALSASILITEGDLLPGSEKERFGTHNDFNCYIPDAKNSKRGWLWVNHEDSTALFVEDKNSFESLVGGSWLRVQEQSNGHYSVVPHSKNARVSALTPIAIDAWYPDQKRPLIAGTMANCAGGFTPWGTVLTCEENFEKWVGDIGAKGVIQKSTLGWDHVVTPPGTAQRRPDHFGWVVELNPKTRKYVKRSALGRFGHEGATVVTARDGRPVVYMGDDADDRGLYKFVGDKAGSLSSGELFVADLKRGRWISLSYSKNKILRENFSSAFEALVCTRQACELVGGSALARPEDIEIHPKTGDVYVSLTNNKSRGNYYGSLLRLQPRDRDHLSNEFQAEEWMMGGEETGFACPDNLAFDSQGNLWMCTDMSGGKPYQNFGRNALFVFPSAGKNAGEPRLVAVAPVAAEFTGPWLNPSEKTLFLSVQHPGEDSKSLADLTSHWPHGRTSKGVKSIPRSAVVTITGDWSYFLNA